MLPVTAGCSCHHVLEGCIAKARTRSWALAEDACFVREQEAAAQFVALRLRAGAESRLSNPSPAPSGTPQQAV